MKLFYYLLMVFFCLSKVHGDDEGIQAERLFMSKLLTLWPSALRIEKLNEKIFNNGEALSRPPLTWWPILKVEGVTLDGKNYIHCLYFFTPHHSDNEALERPGLLKVVEIGSGENCTDQHGRNSFADLSGVEQLQVDFTYPANQLILKFFYYGRAQERGIPFYNISTALLKNATAPRRINQWDLRGVSTQSERYRPGIHLGPLLEHGQSAETKVKWHDDLINKAESMCRTVDDQCHVIGEDVCHRCAIFSQSTNAYGCTSTFARVCGLGRCGEKEAPACPRGHHYLSVDVDKSGAPMGLIEGACTAGLKSGICRPGLKPFCNERGVQICL